MEIYEGLKIGKLTIIKQGEPKIYKNKRVIKTWVCKCDCGNVKSIAEPNLLYKNTRSCGCLTGTTTGSSKNNEIKIEGSEGKILLNDKVILFDAEDYDKIKKYYWYIDNKGYAVTVTYGKDRLEHHDPYHLKMHNLILEDKNIDHINNNKCDNRKVNLRHYNNNSENSINKNIDKRNKTGYYGVYQRKNGKYCARIQWKHKQYYLGTFDSPEEAAKIRDQKAIQLCNNYAKLNYNNKKEEQNR